MAAHIPSMARTLYDFSLYGEVSKQRVGRTIGYYALLLLVTSLILATTATLEVRSAINKHVIPELHKLPVVTIKNHQASANVPQPWVKSFEDENNGQKMVAIIDTTGKITDFQPGEIGFILTRTQLLMRNQNGQSPTLDLKDVDDMVIDATFVKKWIPWVLAGTFGIVLVFGFLWYVFAKLFLALVLSLVGLVASATRSTRSIGYGRVLMIAMYAITPAIALDLLEGALQLHLPMFWLVYLAVGSVYTVIAVRKAPDDELPAAPPPAYPGPGGGNIQSQPPTIF
jgi:hypothetical protein